MLTDFLSDRRQRVCKGHHVFIFSAFSHRAEAEVITILLAALGVATCRLDMAIGEWANPEIGPSRRNSERLDPPQRITLCKPRPVRSGIGEAGANLLAANSGTFVRG